MKRKFVLLLGLALWLALTGSASAQSGGGYDLAWWAVPGGGDLTPSGGGYTLMGAAGQAEPGAALTGGGYELAGGAWIGVSTGGDGGTIYVYLPIILKNR